MAALAGTKRQSAFARPRTFAFRIPAIVQTAEGWLDAGPRMLTLRIADLARRAAVDGTAAPPDQVLGDVRRGPEPADHGHDIVQIVALVGAEGAAPPGRALPLIAQHVRGSPRRSGWRAVSPLALLLLASQNGTRTPTPTAHCPFVQNRSVRGGGAEGPSSIPVFTPFVGRRSWP